MEKSQQYRGESLRRIPQFLDAHPDVFSTLIASDARKQLDAAVAKVDATVGTQGARVRDARGERQHQVVLERELRDQHMVPISKFALGKFPSDPKIGALNPSASKFKGARLVSAARTMAEAATPHAAQFAAAGFPADFAQQLLAAADAVQASIDLRSRMHSDRQNLTATVEQTLKLGRSAALMLEGAIGRLVPRSSPLYSEWQGVKRIRQTSARTQPPVQVPAPVPVQVPKAA